MRGLLDGLSKLNVYIAGILNYLEQFQNTSNFNWTAVVLYKHGNYGMLLATLIWIGNRVLFLRGS